MPEAAAELPDLQAITRGLNAALHSGEQTGDAVTILAREPNPHASTYPSEILTCQFAGGREVRMLCKYAAERTQWAYGHRGGVAYEAEVYRQVLGPLAVSAPRFYGLQEDPLSGETWFFLEFMDNSVQVRYSQDRALDRQLMYAAARWLGAFHRVNQSRIPPASLPFLHRHDAEYYLGWAERTSQLAGPLHQRFPWLSSLCERFETVVDGLLEPPAIIIHGEYYPDNILFREGIIYPVDWESTAIGIGEIDFASLTENWPAKVIERCQSEYLQARWPEEVPAGFARRVDLSSLYWRFRWLGERAEWTLEEKSRWRFDHLREIGERLGLI